MQETTEIEIVVASAIDAIPEREWDACAAPERADGGRACYPFLRHRFFKALEDSGSVGGRSGWQPLHLSAFAGGQRCGVMPLYAKSHSQGEYVFDHAWAQALEQAGGAYYPKLQSAIPFTPVTAPHLLVHPDAKIPAAAIRAGLLQGAVRLAEQNDLSSLHLTFCPASEWAEGEKQGFLQRSDIQFHWQNQGYRDFEAFLADLSARKRKQIRKERARATASGIAIHRLGGQAIEPAHWDAFWEFYQDTGARKWGMPYLTRAFFDVLHERMREDVLLVMCENGGRWVAGALNLIGRETLFGRYWGCIEDHPCLHFETCYYQAIEFAIQEGLLRVEAGAQGPHKLARGYQPVATYSLHWIADPGFRRAVARYLRAERAAMEVERMALSAESPFRKDKTV